MNVPIPVYLFDVIAAGDPTHVVVTCRNAGAAADLVARLNAFGATDQLYGAPAYAVAPPRVETVFVLLQPGTSVSVTGYEVASEAVAGILLAAHAAAIAAEHDATVVADDDAEDAEGAGGDGAEPGGTP